jgi:cytochrome c-type protein NapC
MSRVRNGGGTPRRASFFVLSLVFVAGILSAVAFDTGLHATNEMSFCISCHTMQINFREYQQTIHYKNRSGVRAVCSDCHVPKAFLPKMIVKLMAAKDVYHEIVGTIDTPAKYEAHRWEMASRVWARMKATDSQECRSCHALSSMDLAAQDHSANKRHGRAKAEGKTCIECHKGIAHHEPDEPDLDVAPGPGRR